MQRFTKTNLKKSSFPLKVCFKDLLNHTCILSKHHLEIILHYLNILQYNVKMLLDLFLTTSPCRNRGPNTECPAVMGETAGHVGTKYICVRLVPGSRFLIRIPNPYPNTNTNQQ